MRVINVLASEDDGRVKLLESKERPYGRYVALSYVWGKHNENSNMHLMRANRSDFMAGIALKGLPQTLQDAARVTRLLDIQ
jgi:hypothetical protein